MPIRDQLQWSCCEFKPSSFLFEILLTKSKTYPYQCLLKRGVQQFYTPKVRGGDKIDEFIWYKQNYILLLLGENENVFNIQNKAFVFCYQIYVALENRKDFLLIF